MGRRLFWSESQVIRVLDADRAEKKVTTGSTGKYMSKVILGMPYLINSPNNSPILSILI
jgi:hypothetical protein